MAKIRRNWSRLQIAQRIVKCKAVIDGITDHASLLPAPAPTLVALTATYTAAKAANDLVVQREQELTALRLDSKAKNDLMLKALDSEASTSEGATGGNPTSLTLLGWDLADAAPTAVGELPKITELTVTTGDNDGELKFQWHPEGASSYESQTTATINDAASWVHGGISTKSSQTLGGLPSATRRWVRVRGIGAAGPGPWSDPVSKLVP